jgi:hypothetical protein
VAVFTRCGVPHRVLSNVKAKKVEAWEAVVGLKRMRDPRLTRLQGKPQRAEPLGDQVLTALHDSATLMEDHQVVSIGHHVGGRPVMAAPVWEGLRDGRFQAMEGDMRQQG